MHSEALYFSIFFMNVITFNDIKYWTKYYYTIYYDYYWIYFFQNGYCVLTDQGGLQSFVDEIEFCLCFVVESLHEVFLGFFPVTQLGLNQSHIVENLWQRTLKHVTI